MGNQLLFILSLIRCSLRFDGTGAGKAVFFWQPARLTLTSIASFCWHVIMQFMTRCEREESEGWYLVGLMKRRV
jgi:hypothetical protein